MQTEVVAVLAAVAEIIKVRFCFVDIGYVAFTARSRRRMFHRIRET